MGGRFSFPEEKVKVLCLRGVELTKFPGSGPTRYGRGRGADPLEAIRTRPVKRGGDKSRGILVNVKKKRSGVGVNNAELVQTD